MKIRNVVRTCVERRKISLLKDEWVRVQVEEDVIELVDVWMPNLWGLFKDGF